LTICAERGAIAAAVAGGHTRFRRLALVSDAPDPVSPCGACRQVLAEFGRELVVESHAGDRTRSWTIAQLLPDGFSADVLQ